MHLVKCFELTVQRCLRGLGNDFIAAKLPVARHLSPSLAIVSALHYTTVHT